jgi:hypothetical protein
MSLAHPGALAAEHALVGIITEKRVAGVDRQISLNAAESVQLELEALMGGDLLQFALLVLGAVGAIQRMM